MARGRFEKKKSPKKKHVGLTVALCILIALTLLMGGAALYVVLSSGALRETQPAPSIRIPEPPQEQTQSEPKEPDAVIDSYTIRRNGQLYRYNDQVVTLLLLGVDADSSEDVSLSGGRCNVFSDAVILAAMDRKNQKVTMMSLNRDTMCEFAITDETGAPAGTGRGQLALSYSFGDGFASSCEITRQAVSQIMSDLPIYSCSALYFDGIGELNDAVGGVTVTLEEDFAYYYKGRTLTMDADLAHFYIRYRDATADGNLKRLSRQRQYFKALVRQCVAAVREKPTAILDIYKAIQDDLVTDLSLGEIIALATEAVQMDISGDVIHIAGEVRQDEQNYVQYYLDENALLDTILSVYYEPIGQ